MKDRYFQILGLNNQASEQEIKRAYRKLVLKYHPDKDPSELAQKKFLIIQEAYEILTNQREIRVRKSYSYQDYSVKSTAPRKTKPNISVEEKKKRFEEAQKLFKEQKAREFEENERFYKVISEGKLWNRFRIILVLCTFLSAVFLLDNFLPRRFEKDVIVRSNKNYAFQGLLGSKVMPIETAKNGKMWIDRTMYFRVLDHGNCYVEKTFWLNDITKVWTIDYEGNWIEDDTDFSVTRSFPLTPIILIIPLLTYMLKSRTIIYSFLFHTSLYFYSIILVLLLYSNDRWAHLITLGFL